MVYDVGSRVEERGHSGFAHLFEHMMFQGSGNVPKGEHFKLVTSHGGTLNGTTNQDRTNYFEMLPRSELPLALWLEADLACELAEAAEKGAEEIGPGTNVVDSCEIEELLDLLVDEVARDAASDAAETIAESIVVEALALLGNLKPTKAKTLDPRVKTALVRLERDPAAPIGLDEVANGLKISRFELTRIFRRDIGRCPYPYVVSARIAHAVHLLETGKCSLVQAALASGFSDYDTFATSYLRAHARA